MCCFGNPNSTLAHSALSVHRARWCQQTEPCWAGGGWWGCCHPSAPGEGTHQLMQCLHGLHHQWVSHYSLKSQGMLHIKIRRAWEYMIASLFFDTAMKVLDVPSPSNSCSSCGFSQGKQALQWWHPTVLKLQLHLVRTVGCESFTWIFTWI